MRLKTLLTATAALLSIGAFAQTAPEKPRGKDPDVRAAAATSASDIPSEKYAAPIAGYDYVKRVVMVPMRDGVKLYTVIVVPKGAAHAPMILTRTPYNAKKRAERSDSATMLGVLPQGDEPFVRDGYIRVFQDVRGKYGSEGDYVMTRPPVGPLNRTQVDHTTDAWDTIDWLVKNVPESNGKVGMLGSSYEGFTVVMALLNPHPALKVAAPESPMIDGWMGDDWFHYGAFRQNNVDYIASQEGQAGEGKSLQRAGYDDYTAFLAAGSTGAFAEARGLGVLGWWNRMSQHPAYDAFWQGQALDKLIAQHPSDVPTLWEQGLWDQEDMWGAVHSYAAMKAAGKGATNHLVMGPWRHSQANYDGSSLGPLRFEGDTALQFRRDMLKPFFDQYLKDGAPAFTLPAATVYNTGENRWDRFAAWPAACESGCARPMTPIYLGANGGLSFAAPGAKAGGDSYVSDPAKPVPYLTRPVSFGDGDRWKTWLVQDQRFVDGRQDVLSYLTAALTKPVRISGSAVAELFASTTGTDADWVVKLIDVYPEEVPSEPKMGGYELAVALDIFRGRYRDSFERPTAIPAGKVQRYRFQLPPSNHVFLPGHRIMVQVQSTLFPLYDRNPQTFVPNIFFAKPGDYRKATQTVMHQSGAASAVWLPVVE